MKTWIGDPPEYCDLCSNRIFTTFIDGRTRHGPWANMCLHCHMLHGVGLGTGKGQKYQLDRAAQQFHKVEG